MKRCALLGVVVGTCAGGAVADTVVVPCGRDNTLYESITGTVSNGSGPYFFVGMTTGGERRRGLIRFDVASAIPAGSTVTGAQLKLNLSKTISFDLDVWLYRALKDWGEGASTTGAGQGGSGAVAVAPDATWLHSFYDTVFWSAPGGTSQGATPDYAAESSALTAVGNPLGIYTWGSTPGMVSDVQAWLDNAGTNFGWFIIADETGSGNAKRFDSRENPVGTNQPVLVVTFTPPTCYANCDGSTNAPILNVNDFICFNNKFQAGDAYANCDGSTLTPVLNVNDFTCFLNRFAVGCP